MAAVKRKRWVKGEHWDVFECIGSSDGEMQLQGVDEKRRDDSDAIKHVIAAAKSGDAVAIDALWEVLDEDGLVNRMLWKMAVPSIDSIEYPAGFHEAWSHLSE